LRCIYVEVVSLFVGSPAKQKNKMNPQIYLYLSGIILYIHYRLNILNRKEVM